MIEKLEGPTGLEFNRNSPEAKINELIEASSRQDRILAQLVHHLPGGAEQLLDPKDYEQVMAFYVEQDAGNG